MKVAFITRGGPHLASYRLRIEAPTGYLREHGVEVGGSDADCHIFSKHWDYGELEVARRSPCAIFDVCDDHFGGVHGDYYRAMCAVCRVVVSSRALGEIVFRETGKVAEYIPEPYELPEGEPKEPGPDPLGLWFGHSANWGEFVKVGFRGKLLACSNMAHPNVVPYSRENLIRCLEACDYVIIPQSREWKSANRLVESLRSGRFVVASDIPAYRGFSQYLGPISEGVEWLKSNRGLITERIISGRKELNSFSPENVGRMWLNFISAAVGRSSGATTT